ncbi:MAG: putative pectin lyase, partial [Caulobacteraceae bacterium]|nr:putative pectin lyase [Caulobacteraceae bacterium]
MSTLNVGAGQQFETISSAVAASRNGDVLQIQAGVYADDFSTINTNITLQGVGGFVHVKLDKEGMVPNDKGFFVTTTDVTFDHFEFDGARGGSGNDAGIRYQSGNLTVLNSYFHDNQNGILGAVTGADIGAGSITIKNSEFFY